MATRRLRVFSDEDIIKISEVYNEWRKIDGHYEDIAGFCMAATLEEIKKQDYKLTPGIYVGTEDEEDDGIPFKEKMQDLSNRLIKQFEISQEIQKVITQNLKDLV